MFKKGLENLRTDAVKFCREVQGKIVFARWSRGVRGLFFQEIYYVICEFNKFEFSKEGPEPHPHHYIDPNMNSDSFLRKLK